MGSRVQCRKPHRLHQEQSAPRSTIQSVKLQLVRLRIPTRLQCLSQRSFEESPMIERSLFRVRRSNCEELVLTWDETIEVIESGDWSSIENITKDFLFEDEDE